MTTPLKKVPIHLQSAANRLLIKNGTIVNADVSRQEDIYIEEGMVKMIGSHLIIPGGARVIDAVGKMILPGGIDMRVGFQSPRGDTQTIDDFYRGTKAAIGDGTTTVVDMVQVSEDESIAEALEKWKTWAGEKSCCDFAFKVLLSDLDEKKKMEMEEVVESGGINSFFLSMRDVPSGGGDAFLIDALQTSTRMGALLQVQCEFKELVKFREKKVMESGIRGPEGHALTYSEATEEEGTMKMVALAGQLNCPLYVANLMSPSASKIVAAKKGKGNVLFAETLTAGIGADGDSYWDKSWTKAAAFVCSPPIRSGASDDLRQALCDGHLDILASQHATFNSKQKALGKDDFRKIPHGVNGAESRMSILWDKCVRTGAMSPNRFVAVTSAIPAKIMNLYPDKGCIAVGSDADLVIWDPKETRVHSARTHHLKTDFNIFEGTECKGAADIVICGGRVMVEERNLKVMQGYGKFLKCPPFSPFVFDKVKERATIIDATMRSVVRSEEDMTAPPPCSNGKHEDEIEEEIPGPPTPPQAQAAPAPSQHESNFDLGSHPNTPDIDVGQAHPNPRAPTVRVRAPPGGKSCGGFW